MSFFLLFTLGLTATDARAQSTGCADGFIADCNGHCAPAYWLGDGYCDDGSYTYQDNEIELNCEAFSMDEGDCDATVCGYGEVADCNGNCAPESWVGDGYCDDGTYTYQDNEIELSCEAFSMDEGDCGTAACGYGEVADCNGNCAPAHWLNDGYCDDGTYHYDNTPIYLNCSVEGWDQQDCESLSALSTSGKWIVDEDGRVVILRGMNMVGKTAGAPLEIGFDEDDINLIADRGFNAIRLGVIWANVEPSPGAYDDDYLQSISQTISMLEARGIYTLVDFHQDQYAQKYGDGAPDWAIIESGKDTPTCGFPLNYLSNWCRSDIRLAWDSFWDNETVEGTALQTHYANMVAHVVTYLKGQHNGIFGYDILNEPYPGTSFGDCFKKGDGFDDFEYSVEALYTTGAFPAAEDITLDELLDYSSHAPSSTGCKAFDSGPLSTLYENLIPTIHDIDEDVIVWYESDVVTGTFGTPISLKTFDHPNIGLTFHNYGQKTKDYPEPYTGPVDSAETYQDDADVPLLIGEFGATPDPDALRELGKIHDEHMLSSLYWTWYNNADYHFTFGADPSAQAVVKDLTKPLTGDNIDQDMLDALTRIYPSAIGGTPKAFLYDPNGKTFTLEYTATPINGGTTLYPTDIVIPTALVPEGYTVTTTNADYTTTADGVRLTPTAGAGSTVHVTISASTSAIGYVEETTEMAY